MNELKLGSEIQKSRQLLIRQSNESDNFERIIVPYFLRDKRISLKIDLYQRPFATVPYLGRGSVDPVLESQIQQGEMITNKRSITRLPEKSYLNYTSTPLLSNISNRINNPAYCVENVASDGWVRGGIPSRELTKDRSK